MVVQQEITSLVEALEANMFGGLGFVFLIGLGGVFALYTIYPQAQNRTIMAATTIIIALIAILGAMFVWPEFFEALGNDPVASIGTFLASLIGGAVLLPVLIMLILGLATGYVAGRGFGRRR